MNRTSTCHDREETVRAKCSPKRCTMFPQSQRVRRKMPGGIGNPESGRVYMYAPEANVIHDIPTTNAPGKSEKCEPSTTSVLAIALTAAHEMQAGRRKLQTQLVQRLSTCQLSIPTHHELERTHDINDTLTAKTISRGSDLIFVIFLCIYFPPGTCFLDEILRKGA